MKIRTDFVSNSSSTSFILVLDADWSEATLGELMGIPEESPLRPVVRDLYYTMNARATPVRDYYKKAHDEADLVDRVGKDFSSEVAARVQDAIGRGANVLVGTLTSDGDRTESFFCMESFELQTDDAYLNSLNCSW